MTKKHYIKLASILAEFHYCIPKIMIIRIADWLDNEFNNFDRRKFFEMCSPQEE